jgi:hypothetical protein
MCPVFCFQVKVDDPASAVSGYDGEALAAYAKDLSFVGLPELAYQEGLGRFGHRRDVTSLLLERRGWLLFCCAQALAG